MQEKGALHAVKIEWKRKYFIFYQDWDLKEVFFIIVNLLEYYEKKIKKMDLKSHLLTNSHIYICLQLLQLVGLNLANHAK